MNKNCAIYNASNLIGKRWTILILMELYKGTEKNKRYNQLKSKLAGITSKMLSARLKELEKKELITRRVDSTSVPIKTEYALTKNGEELIKIIEQLKVWSIKYGGAKPCRTGDCKMCEN